MSSVDQRIVNMQFNNGQFERGIGESVRSLGKLKGSLNMDGAAKSLSGLGDVTKGISFKGLTDGVESASSKLTAMGVVGVTALVNITNSALDAGKNLAKTFTIDPIKTGFQEYETQINSIQTILANTASKGTTLPQVSAALDELNTYADKTIYNFTEMSKNIGTFTAAGVSLDTSVSAIKGIANLAAFSGASSLQASTGMYQLSQAISSGTVRLQDWNSVQNAGMGGQAFQDSLKETARVHGINVDDIVKKEGSFRDSLKDGWLSSTILTETLAKFTGDLTEEQLKAIGYNDEQIKGIIKMGETANDSATKVKTFTQLIDTLKEAAGSGWGQSWKHIIGDFNEARALWTEVSDLFGGMLNDSADLRNNVLIGWKGLGGRDVLIESLRTALRNLGAIITPIRDAFRDIFPPITSEQLFKLTQGFQTLMGYFKISDTNAANLKSTFRGLFALVDIGKEIIFALAGGFLDVVKRIAPVGDGILGITGKLGEFIVGLRDVIKQTDFFGNAIDGVVSFVKPALDKITGFTDKIKGVVSEIGGIDVKPVWTFSDSFVGPFRVIEALGKFLTDVFKNLGDIFKEGLVKFDPMIKQFVDSVTSMFNKIFGPIKEAFASGNFDVIFDTINVVLMVGILKGLKTFTGKLSGIVDAGSGIFGKIKGLLDGVKDSLVEWQSSLKAKTILTIALAIGILAVSLMGLSMIDSKKLAVALGAISVLMWELMTALTAMAGLSKTKGMLSLTVTTKALFVFAAAIWVLASAMKKFADMDTQAVIVGTAAIGALSYIMVEVAERLSKIKGKIVKGAGALVIFSVSIYILASAIKKLSELSFKEVAKGLIGMGGAIVALQWFINNTELKKLDPKKSLALIAIAATIYILAKAITDLGEMSVNQIIKGLASLALVFTMIKVFVDQVAKDDDLAKTAVAMILMAGAVRIFAMSIKTLGEMPIQQLLAGIGGLAFMLGMMIAVMQTLPADVTKEAFALILIATALRIIAGAVETLGYMPINSMIKGLLAIAVVIGLIVIAVNALSGANALGGAAAFALMAASLTLLIPPLIMLGNMSLKEIVKSLAAIAGVFLLLGVTATILAPLAPVIAILAGSIVLLGLGLAAVGGGLLLFAAGLTALHVATAAGVAAITLLLTTVINLIPLMIMKLAEGLVAFVQTILNAIPDLLKSVTTIFIGILVAINDMMPMVEQTIMNFGYTILRMIEEFLPVVVSTLLDTIIAIMKVLIERIPVMASLGADLVVAFMKGISDNLPRVINAAMEMLIAFLNGFADAIEKNSKDLVAAGKRVGMAIFNAIKDVFFGGLGLGKDLIWGIMKGIWELGGKLKTAGYEAAAGAITGIKGIFSGAWQIGVDLISGMINGIGSMAGKLLTKAKDTVSGAVTGVLKFLGIKSPSRLFMGIGKNTMQGMVIGIDRMKSSVKDSAISIGEAAVAGISKAVKYAGDFLDGSFDLDPRITPVLDMTLLQDAKDIQQALDGIVGEYGVLETIVKSEQKVEMTHKFDKLVVEGVNDKDEFVGTADYAVEDILTAMMRRQSRL